MKEKLYIILNAIVLALILLMLFGCKAVTPIETTHQRDSVRVEVRLDSIYIYHHDSIFRDRWRNGDTVYVTVEKWQTRYKDQILQIHDTITTRATDTLTVQVRYIPDYYRRTSTGFWIILSALLLYITAKVLWRIYGKK